MTYDASNNANPYDPTTFTRGNIVPSLADVFAMAAHRTSLDLRVCMPCKVDKVLGPQFVDVKPLLRQQIFEASVEYPVVTGVLVCMPVSAGYALRLPIQKGDTGILLCCDRALDAYIASDGSAPADPASERHHELTDGIFIPGLVPVAKQTDPTTDMVLQNGKASLHLQKNGTVTFSNGQNELMAQLCKMAQQLTALSNALATAQVLTALGPAPFLASTVTLIQNVATSMQDVTTRLTTLKGT